MDMMATDESPSQISDKIKDMLFSKSAERVDGFRPEISNQLFGDQETEIEDEIEDEVEAELETEVEAEAETEVEDDVQQSTAKVF